jgi:uncharacterized protein YndB with AHSA1/START domain
VKYAEILLLAALASPAAADVRASGPAGFEVVRTAKVAAAPAQVWRTLVAPSHWWDGQHSYSGDARNLTLVPSAGGCFCERVPKTGATIAHGHVVFAQPGALLRLSAALGPLQAEAVTGTLTWALKAVEGGTEITQTYVVGGYVRSGAERLAAPVDMVMSIQFDRLVAATQK